MRFSTASLAASALLLASCGTAYKEPIGDDLATVRITNKSASVVSLGTFEDGETCRGLQSIRTGSNFANDPNSINLPQGASVQIKVLPSKPFSLWLTGAKGATSTHYLTCDITSTFMAKPRASYVIDFHWPADMCSQNIRRLQQTAGTVVEVAEETARRREKVASIANAGAGCK